MKVNEITLPKKIAPGAVIGQKDTTVAKIAKFIEKNCTEALAAVSRADQLIFRGIVERHTKGPVFLGSSRERDRTVDGTSSALAMKICDTYLRTGGFEALRGNSIFCGDESEAKKWGELYMIFPINGFKFTYSIDHTGSNADDYMLPACRSGVGDYFSNALGKVKCPVLSKIPNPIELNKKFLEIEAQKFIKTNKFRKTNLAHCLQLGHDFWFVGNFLAVHHKYRNKLNKLLGISDDAFDSFED